jgi:hypothetical protein
MQNQFFWFPFQYIYKFWKADSFRMKNWNLFNLDLL